MNEFFIQNSGPRLSIGQVLFNTAGEHEFIVPDGVESICALGIAPGRGHGGGGLSWRNNIPVTPGQTLVFILNNNCLLRSDSIDGPNLIVALGSLVNSGLGGKGGKNADPINDGGGNGGNGEAAGGKGGAGGYIDRGGYGRSSGNGENGYGGGGGGGTRYQLTGTSGTYSGFGGGTAPYGQGVSGQGGRSGTHPTHGPGYGCIGSLDEGKTPGTRYGGGGAGMNAVGCIRIIWGPGRAFPSTNTHDM